MAHANVALNFNAFLEKTKLKDDGSNYTDWVRNLRIILIATKRAYVLDAPQGEAPVFPAIQDVMNACQSHSDDYSLVQCGMLYSLEPGLQKRFEQNGAYEMFQELKMVFQAHARVERYEVSDKFYSCKMEENSAVSEHILKMSGLHNRLSQLGVNLSNDAVIDRILQSLPPSYKSFVMNYNMQGMVKTIPEVFSMLKSVEVEIKKEHQVLMVNKTTSFKKGKGKKNFKKDGKGVSAPGKTVAGVKPKHGPKPETECFYCKGSGHWKRNYPKYLADKKADNTKGDEELVVKGYVDASFDTYLDDSKSQTGYVYILNGGVVSWCSSKQNVVVGSTCEAEYMAASEAAHEAIWMKEFITDLGLIPNASGPITLFCDNTGAIALAKEPRFHKKTRHIKRHFNSIHEMFKMET
ncbi:hypothetical protein VPH35_074159 [Triticum aestivum]